MKKILLAGCFLIISVMFTSAIMKTVKQERFELTDMDRVFFRETQVFHKETDPEKRLILMENIAKKRTKSSLVFLSALLSHPDYRIRGEAYNLIGWHYEGFLHTQLDEGPQMYVDTYLTGIKYPIQTL